ncbi:uncharacterized protein EDB93DRAFT_1255676 [Suillus bovinus]|uniref:uncharacterized protein n=1 Tax=Suillus bovinus TaxID=48563 RepID=UPI001B85D508|nr:uncharacterized protein EDB93DRAFT_1255676 [Suillus bovinus]KAG2130933.1 hypothetical protein EDB93DRAFT_1255676 [Suillus bovinus]
MVPELTIDSRHRFAGTVEAANNNLPPLAQIRHFKAGLQWEITTFVTPILQYSAARNIIPVIPSPIAHILHLIPGHTWNYEIHPRSYPAMIPHGGWEKLQSRTNHGNADRVMTCCIFHYQHWLDGIENDGLTILEQVDHTSVPSLMGLRWIKEHLLTLLEEQREGIRDKMAEIQIYTAILDRLKRGRGE